MNNNSPKSDLHQGWQKSDIYDPNIQGAVWKIGKDDDRNPCFYYKIVRSDTLHWTPSCLGKAIPGVKWRILADPPDATNRWFYIECKDDLSDEPWEGGLSGTKEWLGLTDDEANRAYSKKKK